MELDVYDIDRMNRIRDMEKTVKYCMFKQKTADEMRISDRSSDVCSSDLRCADREPDHPSQHRGPLLFAGAGARPGGDRGAGGGELGRASCRERVCQYV